MTLMLIQIVILIVSVVIHELAHGWVAYKLGDNTAKEAGRLTLNPFSHLEFFGSFLLPGMLMLMGTNLLIGWAKPVPVQAHKFHNPRVGLRWVALAGPVSNLLLAAMAILGVKLYFPELVGLSPLASVVVYILMTVVVMNVILAIFNMFPIPPLDGSKVLMSYLPEKGVLWMQDNDKYGLIIVMALAYFGVFSMVLEPVSKILVAILLGK